LRGATNKAGGDRKRGIETESQKRWAGCGGRWAVKKKQGRGVAATNRAIGEYTEAGQRVEKKKAAGEKGVRKRDRSEPA